MNTASIYDSAIAGLQYAQAGMVTTSQNVTGSNVAGYVRRNPNLQISTMSPTSREINGTAFSVEGFTRNFSTTLQNQLLAQQSKTSYTATLTQAVSTLDAMLVDPSASIGAALANFFNAAGSLANDPANTAYQHAFTGAANLVGDRVRGMAQLVGTLAKDAQQGLADVLNQANALSPQLADVNARIRAGATPGVSYPSADLLDERDRITTQLQELLGGTTTLNEDGTASFQIKGVQLVDREVANQFVSATGARPITSEMLPDHLFLEVRGSDNRFWSKRIALTLGEVNAFKSVGTPADPAVVEVQQPATTSFESGQAGAYYLLLNSFVPNVQKSLNLLAMKLVHEVNHVKGDTGADIPAVFGFQDSTQAASYVTDLGTVQHTGTNRSVGAILGSYSFQELMQMANPASSNYSSEVDSTLRSALLDHELLASQLYSVASFDPAQFSHFSATSARDIDALRPDFSNSATFITSSIATTVSAWKSEHKTNETMSQVLSDQKNAISGVNLDEEAANLVKYQQLYNASSKLIQTQRQMFDTLLAMLAGN